MERKKLFISFAQWMREGRHKHGAPASSTQIERTLRECAKILCGKQCKDPRRTHMNQDMLDPEFRTLFRKFKASDPRPTHQLALPAVVFRWLATQFSHANASSPNFLALADLVVLAFFFLLRVGEYIASPPKAQGKKQTVPLRKMDLQLWKDDTKIDHDAPAEVLHSANKVSIALENQKNGQRGQTITHSSTGCDSFCPVRAAARRLDHLRHFPGDTYLSSYKERDGSVRQLRPRAVKPLVQLAATATGCTPAKGYDQDRLGSHSVRASGAMALKLQHVHDTVIQKLGRWSSDTFQRYIRPQISNLTAGLAGIMTTPLNFSYTH